MNRRLHILLLDALSWTGLTVAYEAHPTAMPELLRCDSPPDRNWIHIQLQGTRPDRDGLGARVRARAGGLEHIHEVYSSGGISCQQ